MKLTFSDRDLDVAPGETVLECIERHGLSVPSFCRSGVCQSCVLRALSGDVPAAAQVGLKSAWKREGRVLACVCRPVGDLVVARCDEGRPFRTRVVRAEEWAPRIFGVWLERPADFDFRAGQFVHLARPHDGLMRPYSIASTPDQSLIELHLEVRSGGLMSGWLTQAVGESVDMRGPFGDCVYDPTSSTESIVLAGTGTGLSPLLGVLRAALAASHRGPIRLYHGARSPRGLYRYALLGALDRAHENVTVVHSVLEREGATSESMAYTERPIERALFEDVPQLVGSRVYLCGNPEFVRALKKKVYLAGVSLDFIHSDPFVTAQPGYPPLASVSVSQSCSGS